MISPKSALTAAAGLCLVSAPGAPWAAEVEFTPRLEVRETYTDNVLLSADNRQDDFVTVIAPGFDVRAVGPRLRLDATYTGSFLYFANQDSNDFRNRAQLRATSELVDDRVFLNANALVEQTFVDRTESFSFSDANITENRSTIQSYSISPSVRGTISQEVEWNLSYILGLTFSDEDDEGSSGIALSDSINHTVSFTAGSGRNAGRFTWRALGQLRRVDRIGGQTFANDDVRLELGYRLDRSLRFVGSAGYERTGFQTFFGRDNDGVVWDAGLDWTPNRRASLSVRYGQRIEEDTVELDARFNLSDRTRLFARYNDELTTSQQVLQQFTLFPDLDDQGNPIFNPITGAPQLIIVPVFTLNDLDFRRRLATVGVTHRRGRSRFQISAFGEQRDFDETLGLDRGRSLGGSFSASRDFSRKASGSITFRYRYEEFEDSAREDNEYLGRVRFNYDLSQSLTGSLSYIRTQRESDLDEDFVENAIALSVTARF